MGIPEGIPEARLHGIINMLKPYSESRSIVLNAFPSNSQVLRSFLTRARGTGIDTVGIRISKDATSQDIKALCAMVPQVSSLGLKLMGYGLTNGDDVAQMVAAGFVGFAGPVFGGPFVKLPAPYSLPVSRLIDPQQRRLKTSFLYA
jgi:hypothetical protein